MEYSINKLYRAWNPITKRMIYIEGKSGSIDVMSLIFCEDKWWIELETEDDVKILASSEDKGILMKYIGIATCMPHKETKPIFESDIVRHENGFIYCVEWSLLNGWWCLVQPRIFIEDEYGGTSHPLEKVYTGGIKGQDIKRCDIIGDIHQKPELLKEK